LCCKDNFHIRNVHATRDYTKSESYINDKKDNFNFKYKSLINFDIIPLKNILICTLHLRIRIFTLLLNQFISLVCKKDGIKVGTKISRKNHQNELSKFSNFSKWIDFLKENCQINITEFNSYNERKGHKITRDFTGGEIRKILEKVNLTSLFPDIDGMKEIQELWQDFNLIDLSLSGYDGLNQNRKKNNKIHLELNDIREQISNFFVNFKKIYLKKYMTPYFHVLTNHVEEMLENTQNLNLFSQQGLEKLNNFTTKEFFLSTNKKKTKNSDFVIQILFRRMRIDNFKYKNI